MNTLLSFLFILLLPLQSFSYAKASKLIGPYFRPSKTASYDISVPGAPFLKDCPDCSKYYFREGTAVAPLCKEYGGCEFPTIFGEGDKSGAEIIR